MEEINLKELLQTILRRWWIIFICTLICVAGAVYWSYYHLIPIYQANTTLYVGKNIESQGQIAASELALGAYLIADYREIARSKMVAYTVIEELGLQNFPADAMIGKIGVSQKGDSRVIQISVTDTNPQMAMDITNKVAEVFQGTVTEIMKIENVQILDRAELPRYPISPNEKRNIIMAFAAGMALGVGIILLIDFLDNNINTPDDVKKYVDLPIIGAIPVYSKRKGGI
jgi:capsular polysaccharide biosynthesis protein